MLRFNSGHPYTVTNMKVKQLIKELEAVPQNLDVEVEVHSNYEWATVGTVCSIFHFIKEEYHEDLMSDEEQREFDDMVDECVIIRC